MSTFILNPGDSIVHSDTIVVKLTKMAETCQSCVKVPETNWADVEIVSSICWAVVVSVLIIAATVWITIWNNNKKEECKNLKEESDSLKKELNAEKKKNKELQAELDKLKANKPPKTNSELATDLLKEISNLAKTKDSKTDEGTAEKLFGLYIKIKKDFMGHE